LQARVVIDWTTVSKFWQCWYI